MQVQERPTEHLTLSASVSAVCVDPARVAEVWPHVRGLIHAAVQRGDLDDYGYVQESVLTGRALLWLAWDGVKVLAAATTQLTKINGRKRCEITACGGEGFDRFGFLIENLEQYARDEKCHGVRMYGRRGWLKKLPKYKLKGVILERGL